MRNRSSGVLEVTSTIESFGPNVGLDLPLFDHNLIGWGACAGADVGNDADEDEDEDEGSLSGNMIIVRNATTGKDSPMQSSLAKKTRMLLYCWKRKLRTSSSFLFFSFLFFSFLFFSFLFFSFLFFSFPTSAVQVGKMCHKGGQRRRRKRWRRLRLPWQRRRRHLVFRSDGCPLFTQLRPRRVCLW